MRPIKLVLLILVLGCSQNIPVQTDILNSHINSIKKIRSGLDILLSEKMELINGKSIGLVTNNSGLDHKGIPNYKQLMKRKNVDLKIIFSPEHGLFGEAADGEEVSYNQVEAFPEIISLYGGNRKPTFEQLSELDLIIYDIQDIGARFYTYISTLGLVMEAAAEANIKVIVLDRPNPINGIKIEGPILEIKNQSFVGYYPIPIRYGLTIGELAKMIIGENWINKAPELEVIPLKNWDRSLWLDETNINWVKPSPNIPSLDIATIYPGMCLLEATNMNEGRGTNKPFKRFGAPWVNKNVLNDSLNALNLPGVSFIPISYIPSDISGVAINPKYKNKVCNGVEIIINNRNNYNSVHTGFKVLMTLKKLYPNDFKINSKRMKKLWGKDNFGKLKNLDLELDHFSALSKKYHLYE
ncbi:MAG: exo-beta-N-acetylmuramidase NamZ family protein [Fidelibacterota bacterium]|jgi:uncharacterized protein YbbC (DUF1343 family)|tara:strand:+ start:2247 stop:3479 length:1233 start_codon:yes stop_codon:yes gene_type:complete